MISHLPIFQREHQRQPPPAFPSRSDAISLQARKFSASSCHSSIPIWEGFSACMVCKDTGWFCKHLLVAATFFYLMQHCSASCLACWLRLMFHSLDPPPPPPPPGGVAAPHFFPNKRKTGGKGTQREPPGSTSCCVCEIPLQLALLTASGRSYACSFRRSNMRSGWTVWQQLSGANITWSDACKALHPMLNAS